MAKSGGYIFGSLVLLASWSIGAVIESPMIELKMQKRFGIGMSAAGPLSILGIEVDVNLDEQLSLSGGIGTGIDYSSFMLKAKYYIPGKWVSPYVAAGVARWFTGAAVSEASLKPGIVGSAFLDPGADLSQGFSIWMFYPALGVEFMHPMGLAFFAEVQYLFKLFNFANGTYAGVGAHWYF